MKTLILALDTTGLPNFGGGFEPRVISIGAAILDDAGVSILRTTGVFVCQDIHHLHHPAAAEALRINEIPIPTVLNGHDEQQAAELLRQGAATARVTGFNLAFIQAFLSRPPWSIRPATWDPDIMVRASRASNRKHVSLKQALQWCAKRGHDIEAPDHDNPTAVKATGVAQVALALAKEGF